MCKSKLTLITSNHQTENNNLSTNSVSECRSSDQYHL